MSLLPCAVSGASDLDQAGEAPFCRRFTDPVMRPSGREARPARSRIRGEGPRQTVLAGSGRGVDLGRERLKADRARHSPPPASAAICSTLPSRSPASPARGAGRASATRLTSWSTTPETWTIPVCSGKIGPPWASVWWNVSCTSLKRPGRRRPPRSPRPLRPCSAARRSRSPAVRPCPQGRDPPASASAPSAPRAGSPAVRRCPCRRLSLRGIRLTASAPAALAIFISASASAALSSDQSLNRFTSATARRRRPASRARSPASAGSIPSNSGCGRSLRTSIPTQPSRAASATSSRNDSRATVMWFRAKRIIARPPNR